MEPGIPVYLLNMRTFLFLIFFLCAFPITAMDIDFRLASGVSIADSATFNAGCGPGFSTGLSYSFGDSFGLYVALDGYWILPVLTSEWVVYRGQVGGMASLGLQYDFGQIWLIGNSTVVAGIAARLGNYLYTDIFLFYPGLFLEFHGDVFKINDNWFLTAAAESDYWFRKDLDMALDIKIAAGLKWVF